MNIFQGQNPKQIAMNMIRQNANPMISNLIRMADEGNKKGVEEFARNIMKQKGLDFDKEFANFMQNFKR